MGRRPSFLHGREVGPTVLWRRGVGLLQQFDIWVLSDRGDGGGGSEQGDAAERRATDGRRDNRQSETE